MTEPLRFSIPVRGRFVTGDMGKKRATDHQNKPLAPEKQDYQFGIAFPKQDFWAWMTSGENSPWVYLNRVWANDPQMMQRLNAWFAQPGLKGAQGGLSMKIGDGDAPNSKGQISENTKGHFVLYCSSFGMGESARPPSAVAGPDSQRLVQIDISQVKRGDYVTFSGSMNPNGLQGNNAGIYLNCDTVWLLEQGEAIVGGGDPTAAFGGVGLTASYDPSQGAAASFGGAPAAPNAPMPPTGAPAAPPTAPAAPSAPPAAPPAAPATTASPGNAPAPHYDVLQPPAAPGTTPPLQGMS